MLIEFRNVKLNKRADAIIGPALRILRWSLIVTAICTLVIVAAGPELRAQSTKAKIVGLGATSCQRFSEDIKLNPVLGRDYLAWAQGFMSGILLSRPAGVDEGLDLNPITFDLVNQLLFLEGHCARNTSSSFSDAFEALYKRLRSERKT